MVATDELKTAGKPERIILTVDKSMIAKDWDDVAYITAKVFDANGIVCPNANKLISFSVSESGQIIAVDNGNVNSHEAYQGVDRQTYNGQCIAIISAKSTTGQITVTANSPDLKSGSVVIDIK